MDNGKCDKSCEDIQDTTFRSCAIENSECYKTRVCKSPKYCETLESPIKVCQSMKVDRRYDYIVSNATKYSMNNQDCKRTLSAFYDKYERCDYCMCICTDDDNNVDRFISLNYEPCTVDKNEVMIGIKFVKINRIIYPHVKCAKLLPYGKVDLKSVRWKKPNKAKKFDVRLNDSDKYFKVGPINNKFQLDEIRAVSDDYVVTGNIITNFQKIQS